jgi:hypothetical protein
MTPAYDDKHWRDVLEETALDWGKLRIVPASPQALAGVPKIEGKSHYAHARETDAAIVQFSDRPGETLAEHFLFYRGLGDFYLPVSLMALGNDHFMLQNNSGAPISTAFVIRVDGRNTRFSVYRDVGGGQEMTLPPASSTSSANLGEEVVKALVAQGLYEKEARAMVKTWESSWFGEEGTGTRVLYMMPRGVTDALIPLHIKPTPDETVRVVVGRIDILTPEQESALASMFPRSGKPGAITVAEALEARKLGRFLAPAVQRAADVQVRRVISAIHAVDTSAAALSPPAAQGQ